MSFTRDVKLEILENRPMRKHHFDALAYGLFLHCQHFNIKEISLRTRFVEIVDEFENITHALLGNNVEVKTSAIGKNGNIYRTWIVNKKDREKLINYFKIKQSEMFEDEKDSFAFLAGAFLSCGNITDPKKGYHLEYVVNTPEIADNLISLLQKRLPKLKTTVRRKKVVVYCKECSQIQDALTIMGASKASLHMIDVEMYKNVRNHVNRITNCETANIGKQVDAATSQIDDINLILNTKSENELSDQLLETARIRVENPYASLRELTELFDQPISRSGLYHRLATISKIADEIREEQKKESV